MADSTAATGLTVQQWDDKFFVEHVQQNRFASEMGTSENAIIQVKEDLVKKKGDSVTFALVNRLTGSGVANGATLEGNEEDMESRSFKLTIAERAHGVRVTDWQNQISAIDLRKAGKMVLKTWAMEDTRDRVIAALASINGVAYGTATAAQRDAWLDDNLDRVLFGAAKSNVSTTAPAGGATNDHSGSLANIDNTADKFTSSAASLMKRIARTASPKIRPVMSEASGRFYYTCYVPSLVFRDLKADATITNAQRDVSLRMQNEKLFKGGDIEWDGIIFKEIEDIAPLPGVGAGAIQVAPVYLCGAQALGYGVATRWRSAEESFDYGRKKGCAIMEMGNIEKMLFGSGAGDTNDLKDHGVVTGFFAAVADA
jgi:N4-gp56 family major capsid protein